MSIYIYIYRYVHIVLDIYIYTHTLATFYLIILHAESVQVQQVRTPMGPKRPEQLKLLWAHMSIRNTEHQTPTCNLDDI